jgi:hypothetical protein
MFDLDLDSLNENPELGLVLAAYASATTNTGEAEPDTANWVQRIDAVDGVGHERLSPIHGKLIALGMLNHRIANQGRGVEYRLSTQGRRSLESPATQNELGEMTESGIDIGTSHEADTPF